LALTGKSDDHELSSVILEESALTVFFLVVVYAPIFEELAFRLWLKFSPARLAVGFGLTTSFLISFLAGLLEFDFEKILPQTESIVENLLLTLSLNISFILLPIIVFYLVLKVENIRVIVEKFYNQKYNYLFYASVFIFGALHLNNFNNWQEILILAPFLFLPQLVAGLSLGYVRVKYGLKWAVLVHAMINFSAVIGVLIPKLGSEKLQEVFVKSSQGETLNSSKIIESLNPADIALLGVTNLYLIGLIILIMVLNFFLIYEYYIFRKKQKNTEI
jgi:hypothetical protein